MRKTARQKIIRLILDGANKLDYNTTMTKRATKALSLIGNCSETLRRVIIFAAQNPGFESCNYFSGYSSPEQYKQERKNWFADTRPVTKRFQEIISFSAENAHKLTDENLTKAAKYAFSGRLEITDNAINYCAGQYFPTEYRKAVLTVLKEAVK